MPQASSTPTVISDLSTSTPTLSVPTEQPIEQIPSPEQSSVPVQTITPETVTSSVEPIPAPVEPPVSVPVSPAPTENSEPSS